MHCTGLHCSLHVLSVCHWHPKAARPSRAEPGTSTVRPARRSVSPGALPSALPVINTCTHYPSEHSMLSDPHDPHTPIHADTLLREAGCRATYRDLVNPQGIQIEHNIHSMTHAHKYIHSGALLDITNSLHNVITAHIGFSQGDRWLTLNRTQRTCTPRTTSVASSRADRTGRDAAGGPTHGSTATCMGSRRN